MCPPDDFAALLAFPSASRFSSSIPLCAGCDAALLAFLFIGLPLFPLVLDVLADDFCSCYLSPSTALCARCFARMILQLYWHFSPQKGLPLGILISQKNKGWPCYLAATKSRKTWASKSPQQNDRPSQPTQKNLDCKCRTRPSQPAQPSRTIWEKNVRRTPKKPSSKMIWPKAASRRIWRTNVGRKKLVVSKEGKQQNDLAPTFVSHILLRVRAGWLGWIILLLGFFGIHVPWRVPLNGPTCHGFNPFEQARKCMCEIVFPKKL